jgi:hypothetical protein
MTQRIYSVTNTADNNTRLVMASNPAQALRHVANNLFDVKAATAIDVANLMAKGAVVEQSKAEKATTTNQE